MDKRTFLKLLSGAATYYAGSGGMLLADKTKLTNWAGNIEYSTEQVYQPSTVEQLCQRIKSESRLKALGTRHCFNAIADSRYGFVSTKSMDEALSVDPESRTVSLNPIVTYGRLAPYLTEKGFALHNLASLPHISVAGACSTGTHGSGEKNGNLPTAVTALEFVNGHGDLVQLSEGKDGEQFRAAVVGLGALGVITRISLKLHPAYEMRQYVYLDMPVEQVTKHFDAIQASGYSVSLFTDWQNKTVSEVWVKCRAENRKMYDGPAEFFGAKRATKNVHPIENLSSENCTAQMGVIGPWYERLPHFRMGFTPSAGKELQTEYLLPRHHAVEAYLAVERLHEQIGPHLLISEIRTMAADDLWMSPAYHRSTVAVHFTWKQDWPAVSKLLPVIERELGPFQPRPHWGKLFTIPHAQLAAAYERMPDFVKLCRQHDPQGKFRNDFLNQNVFA